MARPQREDGHVDIANEIAEQLMKVNLSAYQYRVLWAIWRKTYGWHKKEDRISQVQIAQMTGLDKRNVSRTIKLLVARKILNRNGKLMGFQKDYERWEKSPVEMTSQKSSIEPQKSSIGTTEVISRDDKKSSVETHTKETKETLQKKQNKRKEDFAAYIEQLRVEFQDIGFSEEFKKFELYWAEGNRKLKRPKLALRNWMNNARKWQKDGEVGQGFGQGFPKRGKYTSPKEWGA